MSNVLLNRRDILVGGMSTGLALTTATEAQAESRATLEDALRQRRSTRAFRADVLDAALLLSLAWAAQGVNRPETGLRTSPSWHGAADTRLHLADAIGVRLYDPVEHAFKDVRKGDIRAVLSPQPFVATAPVSIIYTSNVAAMPTDVPRGQKQVFAMVDAAIVAQNVYLFCASRGLGTCLVGGVDSAAVQAALGLDEQSVVTFVQPLGWPA